MDAIYKIELIKEHKELIEKSIILLNSLNTIEDKVEFANRSLQLNAMKNYVKALEARLMNIGIVIDKNGDYYNRVNSINRDCCSTPVGNDWDEDCHRVPTNSITPDE